MIVALTYAIFLFLILRFCIVLFNYISHPKLPPAPRNYYDFVSILVTGYASLAQLAALLQSISEQDFENYEVIIYAGGSASETTSADDVRRIAGIFSGKNGRFSVISKEELQGEGIFASENAACRQLADRAKGDYLMFLSGVERMETGLIYSSLYRMKMHSLSLLSLLTDQKMKTFGEGQVTPLINYMLLGLLPLRLVLLSRSRHFAAASGQFMLFKAGHYTTFQWHLGSGGSYADATTIMKQVKSLGLRAETLLANGYISGRTYRGFAQGMKRLERKLSTGFERNVPALLFYLIVCGIGYLFILPVISMQLLGMALTLIAGMRIMTSLMGNQPVWWNLLFHPLQIMAMTGALVLSIFRILGTVTRKL